MKFAVLIFLLGGLQVASFSTRNYLVSRNIGLCNSRGMCTSSFEPELSQMDTASVEKTADAMHLPMWLSKSNTLPPYWLLSDDLPAWFQGGPPKWLTEKGFDPPSWMLCDEIPSVITKSFGDEGPPIWLLRMNKLPDWFYTVDLLPDWLVAFGEVSPPKWVLKDKIPEWLKLGDIPQWLYDDSEVANMHRWLYAVDGKWPEWLCDPSTYPVWIDKIGDKQKVELIDNLSQNDPESF